MKSIKLIWFLVFFLVISKTNFAQEKYPLVLTITDSKGVQIEEAVQISVNDGAFQAVSPHRPSNIQLAQNEQPTSVKIKGNYFLCGWKFHQRMKELNITVGNKNKENKLRGVVQDAKGNTFFDFTDNFNILVNDKYYFSDSPEGNFTIGIKKGEVPTIVKTLSPYFFMQDWWYNVQNSQIHIVVSHQKPVALRGVVYDATGNKLDDVKIEIAGVRQPAYTKNGGKFTMDLPAHLTLNRNSTLMANGKQIPTGDFMMKKNKGVIYLKMRILEPIISSEKPNISTENTPINGASDTQNTTQTAGKNFVFEDADIEIDTDSNSKIDSISIFQNNINQIINLLEAEKHNLTLSSEEIRRRMEEFSGQLNSQELSSEHKKLLEKEVRKLEKQLINNELSYQDAQEKTHQLITQIEQVIFQKDSLGSASKSLERQYQAEKAGRQKDWLVFGIIGILLAGLAMIFFIYGRKNRQQRQEIEAQNMQLERQKTEILQKNEKLESQSHEIQEHNKVMTDSIHAACYIQEAMLPVKQVFKDNFSESFVFYKPRNILSGDFYHLEKQEDKILLTVADCTGHGVQGALISVLGMSELNKIIRSGIEQPHQIMNQLHQNLHHHLHQDPTRSGAGMDISICLINKSAKTLTFAGAKNPLIYVQDGELHILNASRKSVGGLGEERNFESQTLKLTSGLTTFYMASDGFQDQFGGEHHRKYMSGNFRNLLAKMHTQPLDNQLKTLENTFQEWKGTQSQTDDILVVGFRI